MTYKGHVEKGVIVLDDPVTLKEGVHVRIEVVSTAAVRTPTADDEEGPTLAVRLANVIGTVPGLPPDAAERHDHYLYDSTDK